ncbi:MAG: hypothetical protein M5U23_11710 [Acidimicrobiia bacterium]|nr:hypothetical protein [Acidimicrobiia bacterium]
MARRLLPLVVLAVLASACTGSSDATTTSSSTTSPTPLTSLAPPPSEATTTIAPSVSTTTIPAPTNECVVGPRTSVEGYSQGCDVAGFEILAADVVDGQAVWLISDRMFNVLLARPDLNEALVLAGINARVIGKDQALPDLPEFEELYELYPGTDWDRAARSFPGTDLIPLVAGAEENLMCLDDDRYAGEDPFVRDLAVAIRRFGMSSVDPVTDARIEQSYAAAIAQGLWVNTLAEINSDEYWAEGTQSYFDVNLEEPDDRPPNSSHNHVDTRDELRQYDQRLYEIARSVYGDTEWRPTCP